MPRIRGLSVIITGASAGIGAATAIDLARRGAKVVLAARRRDRLEGVADQCRREGASNGGEAVISVCDVAKRADVEAAVALAVQSFGRLDVMIANAGYGFMEKIQFVTEEQFDEILATNVKGTWYAMQAAARVMLAQPERPGERGCSRNGHIIAVSSGAARRSMPLYGIYSMTKAAQLSLVESMRVELMGKGVYVSSVHPMTTATEFFEVASKRSRQTQSGLAPPRTPEQVARKIAGLIERPRRELWPVPFSRHLLTAATFFPGVGDWVMSRTVGKRSRK